MILLMAIAYTSAIFQGAEIQKKQVQKYVSRRKETRQEIPPTEYIWYGSGWRAVGKLSRAAFIRNPRVNEANSK
jgi:hypothetical protein